MRSVPAKSPQQQPEVLIYHRQVQHCALYSPHLICCMVTNSTCKAMFILQIERRQEKKKCKKEHRIISVQFTFYRTLSWGESFYKNNLSLSTTFDGILLSSMLCKE